MEEYAELLEIDVETARNFFVLKLLPNGAAVLTVDGETAECSWQVDGGTLILDDGVETLRCGIWDGLISISFDGDTMYLRRSG